MHSSRFKLCKYIFIFICVMKYVKAQNYPSLKDNSTVVLSLLNYNVSNPEGESIEYTYTILPNSTITILITKIPGNAYFVILQAHTYFKNATLSYDSKLTPTTSVSGTNIGLWKAVSVTPVQFSLTYRDPSANASLMLAVQAYGNQAPTPGGCNMEFYVESAPYLITKYDHATVNIEFAAAAPPATMMQWLTSTPNHSCLIKSEDHVLYRAYLPERDFTPELYFTALQRMMTVGRIKIAAHEIPLKEGAPLLHRVFAAYPGTGSAYVVVAQSGKMSSVYVPTFSYACDARDDDTDTCVVLTTTFSKFLCAIIFFLGLFACFVAHRFFYIETFLLGFLAGGLVFYTALENLSESSEVLTGSVVGGLVVGLALTLAWTCIALPMLSIILASTTLGYILTSIVLIPLVDIINFGSNFNFWAACTCIILIVPVLLLSLAEKANVLSTSVLGAYATIIPIDYYVGSNLRYIVLNTVRRATVSNFKWAVIDLPFQTNDILLAAFWVLLAISGFVSQTVLIRNKPPFPAPVRWHIRLRGPRAPSERTPLLSRA